MTWHAPASFLQERWFHATADRWCDHNNVVAWRIDGPGDAEAALGALAARHEALRTALHGATQVVTAPGDLPLWHTDLSGSSAPERDLDKLIVEDVSLPFLLTEVPLWRARLVRLGPGRQVLVLVVSHAISDGWSMGVLLRDFQRLLGGARLPELPVQFADYAAWEREVTDPAREKWWRARLPVPRPALPGRPGWQDEPAFRMDGRVFPAVPMPDPLPGVSPATVATAGVLAALSRHVEGPVVVGFMHANRDRAELQPVVGPVFDYLPLRLSLPAPFPALVAQVRDELRAARAHRLPLGTIEQAVAAAPLFDVVVEFLPHSGAAPGPVTPYPVPELTVRHTGDVSFAATAPVNYIVRQTGDGGLDGVVYGNTLAIPPATMAELGADLVSVLRGD